MLDSVIAYVSRLSVFTIISLCILICYGVWTIKVIKHLKQYITMYRTNKRMDFRDIREQNRILYNFETHIVKDIILLVICCAEIGEPIITTIMIVFVSYYDNTHLKISHYPKFNTTVSPCTFKQTFIEIITQSMSPGGWYIYMITSVVTTCMVFLLLLSFLTQYLSKRYFLHPVRKTCLVHIALVLVQTVTTFCLTNRYTHLVYCITVPTMVFIDWCILVRNSKILFRVLRSNVRDLKLNLSDRYLYIEQWRLLQVYKMLIPILLAALFFGVCSIFSHFYLHAIADLFYSHCFNQLTGDLHTLQLAGYRKPFKVYNTLHYVNEYSTLVFISLHFIMLGFPIFCISLGMFYSACVNRCFRKERDYRFNYYNFKEALLKENLRPPY